MVSIVLVSIVLVSIVLVSIVLSFCYGQSSSSTGSKSRFTHLGLGGKRYIGTPKQPTFSVYQLRAGEYQLEQFHDCEPIVSGVFPALQLSLEQILAALGSF